MANYMRFMTYYHTFYPRKDRQYCPLRHCNAAVNVHLLFTICVLSSINTLPDPGHLALQSHLRPLDQQGIET
ncbi:hypothetical protein SFRURICE_017894, partial [Spodoptera frugiperda]